MSVGPWQVVLILVVILVIFGAGKLPSVMKDLAKGVQAFKKGLREEEEEKEESNEAAGREETSLLGSPDQEKNPARKETEKDHV